MPDYNLGRAHGKIEIDYDSDGAPKAIHDLDAVSKASAEADASLQKTGKTLGDTDKQFQSAGTSADGYKARLQDVRKASDSLDLAEKTYHRTLLDEKATISDVQKAHESVTAAKKDHERATNAARDASAALNLESSVSQRVMRGLSDIIPNLGRNISNLASVTDNAEKKTNALARGLGGFAKAVALLGPEAEVAVGGVELLAKGIDKTSGAASSGSAHIRDFVKDVAGFEVAFGKISGLSLAVPSLGGLAGIGGAAGVQGIVEMVEAVRQLSGALGLLPAVVGGVGVVMATLKVATHGVGDAFKDLFADDPKKFLDDISKMGPAAAHSMLQVAQFRGALLAGGGAVQDSFFKQIANDIAPLIQTWLPALVSAGSQIAGILGGAADQFARLLMQPQMMQAFTSFISNISAGLQAMQPAMKPLLDIFTQLAVVGSSFFAQIGDRITEVIQFFADFVNEAASSGQLQQWIQTAINAFEHLGNAVYSFGSAFNNIMNIADKFGGGGLLGFIDRISLALQNWTESAAGQKALEDFFTVLRTATDAFLPILGPLLDGLMSIGQAFVGLGIATAPAWIEFFKTFAYEMANDLGPAIMGMGPAVATFLGGLTDVLRQLMQTIGPQLPQIFQELANAFIALLPQLPQLAALFANLLQAVGPELPGLFKAVTEAIQEIIPLMPQITELFRDFVDIVTFLVKVIGGVIEGVKGLNDALGKDLPKAINGIVDTIGGFFDDLPNKAKGWGKSLLDGLVEGLKDATGLGLISQATKGVVDGIADWFQHSPAKKGPFSGSGYTMVRGQKMVTDMAAGMASAQGAVAAAARSTAEAASGGLGAGAAGARAVGAAAGGGGAPGPGGAGGEGGSLLPPWIARADTSILDKYLQHEFPKNRGLAGLAADMGKLLTGFQNGLNLVMQHVAQPIGQVMGMIPGLNAPTWKKMSPEALQAQQLEELQRKSLQGGQKGPSWGDVLGGGAAGPLGPTAGHMGGQLPLGVTAGSSKEDIQKAIIAAGRSRGMNDAAIQTALAVAAAESGFNPTISGGVQGSAGEVLGLYQQSPSSGWGTRDQVTDPNYAINKFYDAFAAQLGKNPTDPLLAAVLTQNPQLGGGAQGSQYMRDVQRQIGLGGQILGQLGPGVKGPSWAQLTSGGVPTPGAPPIAAPPAGARAYGPALPNKSGGLATVGGVPVNVGPGGALQYVAPSSAGITAPAGAAPGIGLNPASRAGTLGPIDISPDLLEQRGIRPLFQKSTGDAAGGKEIPGWVQQLAAAFGLSPSDHPDTTLHGGQAGKGNQINPMGSYAFDFSGSAANMDRFAQFITTNLIGQTLQLIHRGPGGDFRIAGGTRVGPGTSSPGYYAADIGGHEDHVHWATDVPVLMNGQVPPGSMTNLPAGTNPQAAAALAAGYPDVADALGQIRDNTGKGGVNDQLLQAYLHGNPALASQIDAARQPGASDQQVQGTLSQIGSTITDLKSQDAVGNKNTIDALTSTQSQIAQGAGFQQAPSPAQAFSSAIGGASNVASSVLQAIQGGLDALTATQDIADRLVYGPRNTEDINKMIDDFQKYITEAANIANAAGSILSMAGSMTGGMDFGGTAAAGQAAQMIAGILQGINAGIDFAQEIYHIAGTYVGRFLSTIQGLTGTPLMGDVHMELNKNTGQLISYSADNPENKNYQKVPSWMNQTYDYGSGSNPNPQIGTQNNIYGAPGMSAGTLLNQTVWMANTQGTTGALAEANF